MTIPPISNRVFVLGNGLTLIIHEDRKAPIVAVNIWYHVGSKNERMGKTGFAHLFEHLMFNGSEHYNDDIFKVYEEIGAIDMNGTTDYDRTNYFANVPSSMLDVALWMESDRMGHLLGTLDQAKLEEQRGVVQNELREYYNQPYGRVEGILARHSFPQGHPYSWDVGGSIEDLNGATLADANEWFRAYYNPANAVLVLAGDIRPEEAREKVEKYFAHIPSPSPVTRHCQWIAKLPSSLRLESEERAPQGRLYKVWNVPPWGSREGNELNLIADLLSRGKNSRLFKRLVYVEQIATEVSAVAELREIAGQFVIRVSAKPGADIQRIETIVDEELKRLLEGGVNEWELQKAKTQYQARTLRKFERIGGFDGKSDVLAEGMVFAQNPDQYHAHWRHMEEATPDRLRETAAKWLDEHALVLHVRPFPTYTFSQADADRSRIPFADHIPEASFPALRRARLANGLPVIVAERRNLPLVQMTLMVRAGFAADSLFSPGATSMAMALVDEGTATRSALEIADAFEALGAEFSTHVTLDSCVLNLSSLKDNLSSTLEIFADVALHPQFPPEDFLRVQKMQLAEIEQEGARPDALAFRLLPRLLYGPTHPYGNPLTGTGTKRSIESLTREDLQRLHRTLFVPNRSCLIAVGDTTLEEIVPLTEKFFAEWEPGNPPALDLSLADIQAKPVGYLVDKPGAFQSLVIAGQIFPPFKNPREEAIEIMNVILGESFTSRLNMNLRESKHWTYGARTMIPAAHGHRPWIAYTSVQTDKTGEAIQEIRKEIASIRGAVPVTTEELQRAQKSKILGLPGSRETLQQLTRDILKLEIFELDDSYFRTYSMRVMKVGEQDVEKAAIDFLHLDRLAWIVVGDREKVSKNVLESNLGNINFVDASERTIL